MPSRGVFVLGLVVAGGVVVACFARRSNGDERREPSVSSAVNSTKGTLLAEHGVARMQIVVSPSATADIRRAADELAGYLSRAAHARFEVAPGDGSRGIVVGTAEQFDVGADAKGLAIRDTFNGREAFVVRSEPNRVLIVAATARGVPHAVSTFLDALGFRWFFPAKEWEIVPELPTLRADVHVVDRPRFLSRQMSPGFGFFDGPAKTDYEAWARHNRLGGSLTIAASHAWEGLIAKNKAAFAAHPEYLALSDGKRLPTKLCVSNPEVQRMAVEYAMSIIDHDPSRDMVSMEASDGLGHCECDRCKALGRPNDQPMFLANLVAKELEKRRPGKFVGTLAYTDHSEPPAFRLEPNVFVQMTNGYVFGHYSVWELSDLWPKVVRYTGYYDYYSIFSIDYDELPGGSVADVAGLTWRIRFFAEHAGIAVTAETSNSWGPGGRGYYVASRLLWNPDVDVKAVLDDFYRTAFHAGAPAMRRFYERFDPGSSPLMSAELLGAGFEDVAEASWAAKGDIAVQARLDQIKQYLHYDRTKRKFDGSKDRDARKALALDILMEGYRTRRSYMNHWRAIWYDFSPKASKEFNEPSWLRPADTAHVAWQVNIPPTHEETERRFKAELADLPHVPLPQELTFSKRLVRVAMDGSPPRRGEFTLFMFYQTGRYSLYSQAGEPIEFTVQTGLIPAYINKPAARWTIRDPAGKTVGEGKIPLDYRNHTITQAVAQPGSYELEFSDSGAGYKLTVPKGSVATFILTTGTHPTLGMTDRFYFYVPKHTRTVDYYWQSGATHNLYGPDGSPIRTGIPSGWIRVPVPAGTDGKVWFLQGLKIGKLKFFSVPNLVSTSREGLLVPEDVAKADGLAPFVPPARAPTVATSAP